jgi:hypothetical protein
MLAGVTCALIALTVSITEDTSIGPVLESASSSSTYAATTTVRDDYPQVVSRLRDILRIREEAYRSRSSRLLRPIYSLDCPCLKSDEAAIQELLRARLVWKGIDTSIEVQHASRINKRLWTVDAIFRSGPLRIESEEGTLVRIEPEGSDLFRFTLIRPPQAEHWVLAMASLVEGSLK